MVAKKETGKRQVLATAAVVAADTAADATVETAAEAPAEAAVEATETAAASRFISDASGPGSSCTN